MAPLEQVVPAATACQTTLPWSQMPNCVEPLQTMAPSVVHWPELPALPVEELPEEELPEEELPEEELPEEDDGELVEGAVPVEGPETPWPRVGERVG